MCTLYTATSSSHSFARLSASLCLSFVYFLSSYRRHSLLSFRLIVGHRVRCILYCTMYNKSWCSILTNMPSERLMPIDLYQPTKIVARDFFDCWVCGVWWFEYYDRIQATVATIISNSNILPFTPKERSGTKPTKLYLVYIFELHVHGNILSAIYEYEYGSRVDLFTYAVRVKAFGKCIGDWFALTMTVHGVFSSFFSCFWYSHKTIPDTSFVRARSDGFDWAGLHKTVTHIGILLAGISAVKQA